MLKRSAERPNSPTSGVIWPGKWDYLADFLFSGRKLMLWASKLPRQQLRITIVWTHFLRLTPCWTRFRTLWLRSGQSKFNISVISSELGFFVPYTQSCICTLYYVRTCIFTFDAELRSGGRTIFENQWEGALLFSPGQITPQCHSEQFRQ